MAQDDWFRNTSWTPEIAANFEQRLGRARDKAQRLRIQASCLTDNHPSVALALLDRYFAMGEHFDLAQAQCTKARAQIALGDVDGTVLSYEAALEQERRKPSVKTQAYLDYAKLVLTAGIEVLFERVLEVLDAHHDRPLFPMDRYRAHGTRALLLHRLGRMQDARASAALAMAAAQETRSGFQNHQTTGLVGDINDRFGQQLAELAK